MRKIGLLTVIAVTMILSACSDVFEEDISKDNLKVLAPADSLRIQNVNITFWWELLEDADFYTLQIVSPNFNQINTLWLDSTIAEDKFTLSLPSGTYQWRVRGENSVSETDYVVRTLFVDTVVDLSIQQVLLSYPTDNFITNETNIAFQWQAMPSAAEYRFQIAQPDFNGTVLIDANINTNTYSYSLGEGSYEWRVRAQNSSSNSSYSTRSLEIDTTFPSPPVLLLPVDNAFVGDSVELSWDSDVDVAYDSLLIFSDSTLTMLADDAKVSTENYTFLSGTPGNDYFWILRSFDQAGNKSGYSSVRKFIIQ